MQSSARPTYLDSDNKVVPSLALNYTYDNNFNRITKLVDALGETEYQYHPYTVNGGGKLAVLLSLVKCSP